ncbi:MAG: ECF transporter S component, partial [Methermicoccaceae archaeon]
MSNNSKMKKEDINLNSKVVLGRLLIVLSLCLMLTSLIYPSTGRHLEAGVYSMITLLTSLLVVMGMVMEFEGHEHSTKLIALIAMLGTISAISRVPFVGLPGVQPCTFFTICTGIVFGPVAGFMVGAISAVVSNLFLGEGPWTIFQMLAWGMVGLVSGM